MANELKIKIVIGEISIHIEGPANDVKEQFNLIKEQGLGKIVAGEDFTSVIATPSQSKTTSTKVTSKKKATPKAEAVSLRDIVMKGTPKNEKEWILIYGYISGNSGSKEFTRDELHNQYDESKRRTDSRIANLSNNLKSLVKAGDLRFINDNDIVLTASGKTKAEEIIRR